MRKITLLMAAAAAGALLLTGCGGDDEATTEPTPGATAADLGLVEEGKLTVCSDIPYPPFEVEDADAPSGYSGFDMDVMQEIADRLELELAVQDVGFDPLASGTVLAAGQCDVGASAMTITEERKANLDFSDPYYDSLQSLLVKSDSGISAIGDLTGKKVGVQTGTTGELYANENAPEGTEIVDFPSDAELWPALQADNIDAILQDLPVNIEHAKTEGHEVVEEYETDEQYGFAFAKGQNTELREAVNEQLQTMRDDGKYQEIYDSYFATD